jgi:hypothetical protein
MKIRSLIIGTGMALSAFAAAANPFIYPGFPNSLPGFVVLAEQRYDPLVQRFMAEQSLRAMPLKNGQLYYIYPVDTSNAYIEQMQIRYLEVLLDEKQDSKQKDSPTDVEPAGDSE